MRAEVRKKNRLEKEQGVFKAPPTTFSDKVVLELKRIGARILKKPKKNLKTLSDLHNQLLFGITWPKGKPIEDTWARISEGNEGDIVQFNPDHFHEVIYGNHCDPRTNTMVLKCG